MRILSGLYKGRKIKTIQDASYRPTKSLVRKSLFDILGPLENKSFLDLFSGSGIIGFEALSRGSSKVEFVENNWNHLKLLESNSVYFPESNISINHADVFKYLSSSQKFDIIFADPPYGAFDLDKLFHLVISRVKPTGKYILETNRSNSKLIHNPEVRNYGKTQLAFWGQK